MNNTVEYWFRTYPKSLIEPIEISLLPKIAL